MEFLWPDLLWLLLLVPVLIAGYILAQRRRQRFALRYASLSLVKEALGKGPGWRRHIPPALFLLGLTAMIVALARPQMVVRLPSQEGTIILTIDVSGSMAADDLKPTRMDAAKAAARTFVQSQPPSVRIGVVSFTDTAFAVQAPTTDQDSVLAAIDRLYPQRGTAIGSGLIASIRALYDAPDGNPVAPSNSNQPFGQSFGGFGFAPGPGGGGNPNDSLDSLPPVGGDQQTAASNAVIVLLTDGENNMGVDPRDAAQAAADRGIRVYTIGIGSKEGSILHIQGRSVATRLDEDLLKQVAQTANGAYYNALSEGDLKGIYQNLGTRLVMHTEKTEVTAGLTGLAAVLSIIGGFLSLLWFNRLP